MICGMDGGFAAGELDDLGRAFGADEVVEDGFDFFQGEAEAGARGSEAERAVHVAVAVDFDDAEAGVLLMVGAEAAVEGAAVLDFGAEGERDGAGLVVLAEAHVHLCVAVDE